MSMSNRNDGGAIFPSGNPGQIGAERGMSLRDWFAGQALMGECACQDSEYGVNAATAAEKAYRLADAMLAEREKSK